MEKNVKRVIVIGAGGRGKAYTDIMADMPEQFKVVAVAEPLDERREYIRKKHGVADEYCFPTWEPLLALPKLADVAIIATMDRDHYAPAMAAIEKGYNLLLEKPVSPIPEECRAIQKAAHEKGVFALVCHVLRYTKYFRALKHIIDSGEIGTVANIQHSECVGNVHQSHSFVRGNWRNSDDSSFMLLQKSCHDMDILAWLLGKKCLRAQSFGSLGFFTRENAPEGSPEFCYQGCPKADTCPYNAVKLYVENKGHDWFRSACTQMAEPTDEAVEEAIRTTNYGRCVYKCDNNSVDRQIVNLEFEGGTVVSFTMSAFNEGGRYTRIMGTKGELISSMDSPIIKIYNFETSTTRELDIESNLLDVTLVGGHGGGDNGIIDALAELLNGIPNPLVCDIEESCDNHMIAFAAEESRLTGTVVSLAEYCKKHG